MVQSRNKELDVALELFNSELENLKLKEKELAIVKRAEKNPDLSAEEKEQAKAAWLKADDDLKRILAGEDPLPDEDVSKVAKNEEEETSEEVVEAEGQEQAETSESDASENVDEESEEQTEEEVEMSESDESDNDNQENSEEVEE